MITVGVVTCGRSDLGFYLPLMRAIAAHEALSLRVIATGMHLSAAFGATVTHIEQAGFRVDERVETIEEGDTPEAVALSMSNGVRGFGRLFARWRPDILVVLGDRFDMYPAALAALPFRIPIAHIAGGEVTEGAIDDVLRHCLTKMSHLHFVAMDAYAHRVLQMGEEPWRVTVSGSLAIDNIAETALWPAEETARRFGLDAGRPFALVTYHPVTLEYERTAAQVDALLGALERLAIPSVFTYPNADTAGQTIVAAVERFCAGVPDRRIVVNAGQVGYLSLMRAAAVMVGNSSSGLVEAPSFELPVVNIGRRQAGRERAANVIDSDPDEASILRALHRAVSREFRQGLVGLRNPYGDGRAAERIVARLAAIDGVPNLITKRFVSASADAPATVTG